MPRGTLFIVTAPSGAGKTSLVKALVDHDQQLSVSISHTTRAQRPGEIDGINYHFVSKEKYVDMLGKGDFLESADVYGNHYGTSEAQVKLLLDSGINVILEIDWQGASQVRNLHPEACSIFILPPSLDSLKARLTGRGQDDVETINRRMDQAVAEISHVAEADFIVVNDDFNTALEDIRAVIRSRQLTVGSQRLNLSQLLDTLTQS
ncbi:MAG: guanylate kinase [Gammaproteobacteria bacterium]|jgi:guanylate kinase|nr:guanylate kinase [Gammaproteobacteria bacterium]MBT3860933.1 guanylate kinase [Gammaproteobacteria bacterium]MBT3988456.1 guanylate kinase [Gammaproteobacteria bacterium]MBT4256339.1 guanylate kinase [Gammaproteobacteria bacterium]MBT4581306.1 guanylate kinase [Gammaproteobacteria bacterium]